MKSKWSGDVDLGDGTVDRLHNDYMEQLSFTKNIGLKERRFADKIAVDLNHVKQQLEESMSFLTDGLKAAKKLYEDNLKRSNVAEQSLFALAWEVDGYEKLKESNSKLTDEVEGLRKRAAGEEQRGNLQRDLANFRKDLETYTKGLFGKKRKAASHLLVFMISDELRNFKPYAIPVRVVTYKGITDDKVQELKDELKGVMKNIGMNVVGKCQKIVTKLRALSFHRTPLPSISLLHNLQNKNSSEQFDFEDCIHVAVKLTVIWIPCRKHRMMILHTFKHI